jgi:hypothetical protein
MRALKWPAMRRLARHFLTLCAAILLMLSVAFCVLWVRGYWYVDAIGRYTRTPGPTAEYVASGAGSIAVRRWAEPLNASTLRYSSPDGVFHWHMPTSRPGATQFRTLRRERPPDHAALGFSFNDALLQSPGNPYHGTRETVATVPHWAAVLLTVAPGLCLAFARSRVKRRAGAGLCRKCGYDLRGTPERCPECGTLAAANAVATEGA